MILVTHPTTSDLVLVVTESTGNVLLPGGHAEEKEPLADAAKRKLKEETDLRVYTDDLVPISSGKDIAEPDCVVTVFLARIVFGSERPMKRGTHLQWTNWRMLCKESSFRAFYKKHFANGFSHFKETTWKN